MADFEQLGVFYLGRSYDLKRGSSTGALLLYDSRDLVTHAVCVGMTGSGKTGLCTCLLEEAALDGVPAIAIDPKGDLTNLLLTFPDLAPADFRPWVNEDDARAKGMSPDDYARQQAELWTKGLAAWGQDGERIRRLRSAAEFAVYTPGSTAGIPVSILSSFAAPPAVVRDDPELLAERVGTTATSLLTLLGVDADPIKSREHILLATILDAAWKAGRDLDLAALIQQIQRPPAVRIGVMDLETFYPAKDRFELAMQVNSLAAPGFASWLSGESLDVGSLLYTPQGKPRLAVMYIAHLSDAERMFFVSLLLNQVLGWMRTQSGTTSLRAVLYMDEIFGFFPPVAAPPSKAPLLALLKQARAFGLGVVLATQNPVDLDYKGLSNAGTWFIGRLQTERDKARVLEGLEGAATSGKAAFDRAATEQMLAGLKSRVFLLHNVHEDAPAVFETRWAMSYLRGPLTREQIKTLTPSRPVAAAHPAAAPTPAVPTATAGRGAPSAARPVLPPDIPQHFLPRRTPPPAGDGVTYLPALFASARVQFADEKHKVDAVRDVGVVVPMGGGIVPVDWGAAGEVDLRPADLDTEPDAPAAGFGELPRAALKASAYKDWAKEFTRWVYQTQKLELYRSPSTGLVSAAGEGEREFRIRLADAHRERRDAHADALREKYAPKIAALSDRIRRAEQAVAREQEQVRQQQMQTVVSVGATLLGAFIGRKAVSGSTLGRATTAARGVGRSTKEAQDVARAQENVAALRARLAELEAQFEADVGASSEQAGAQTEVLERVALKPKRTQIAVSVVSLAWAPAASQTRQPLWQ